jgi:hypothetical protein
VPFKVIVCALFGALSVSESALVITLAFVGLNVTFTVQLFPENRETMRKFFDNRSPWS